MSSFADLVGEIGPEAVVLPPAPIGPDIPPMPEPPRPGVYPVLRLVNGAFVWEMCAAPDLRIWWAAKLNGEI